MYGISGKNTLEDRVFDIIRTPTPEPTAAPSSTPTTSRPTRSPTSKPTILDDEGLPLSMVVLIATFGSLAGLSLISFGIYKGITIGEARNNKLLQDMYDNDAKIATTLATGSSI